MSKKKNQVIDQLNEQSENQNAANEKQQVKNIQRDQRRLSIETLTTLNLAAHAAMKEIRGDRTTAEAAGDSELYCELMQMSLLGYDRWIDYERKQQQYRDMEMDDLLKELYQRMQLYYHWQEAEGRRVPGIACRTEQNGVFALVLGECAINLEHTFEDPDAEHYDQQREGRLFCIGLNIPLLETEDPENPESHLSGEYDEFLSFCCEFDADKEFRDIYPSEYSHEAAIRSILAQLDQIGELANEQ